MTSTIITKLTTFAVAAAMTAVSASASAQDSREVLPLSLPKSTEVAIDQYQSTETVVRERSAGRTAAIFRAQASELEAGSVVLFRAVSQSDDGQSVVRWECLAVDNVSDCFSKPVRIAYLANDARIVLEVSARSAAETEIVAQLAAQKMQLLAQAN